jgi:Subtilase family
MSTKALIARRGGPVSFAGGPRIRSDVESLGCAVEHERPDGALIRCDEQQASELEARGYRVKLLRDTNILEVGGYRIDTEAPASLTASAEEALDVPSELRNAWSHYLVQLAGPRTPEWVQAIEARGVDVVEPISQYGLFVVGSRAAVEGLRTLPFVAWVGPFKPAYRIAPDLEGRTGVIRYVSLGVYPASEIAAVRQTLAGVGAALVREAGPPAGYRGEYTRLVVEIDARHLPTLARLPSVRWLEYASSVPGLDGERETQIVAENLNGSAGANAAPVPGYQAWLAAVGLTGAGLCIAICDTGVDRNAKNNTEGHLDLKGRQVAFVDYTGGAVEVDENGHGTHVAGIAVGNAATGKVDGPPPASFLSGQGMAPQATFVTQNALFGLWPPADWSVLTRDAVLSGAHVMNNSWWDGGPPGAGYTANARRFDQLVRDPNPTTGTLDPLIIVFSAGNAGPDPGTMTPPKEAKNPITVGNSLTFRPGVGDVDDIRGIAETSSRGPARDGRILPTVVAPGTNVLSAATGTESEYVFKTGTSMAAPHVAGACALILEWWRGRTGRPSASAAMLKALLVNGAEDLAGGPDGRGGVLTHIPNNDQGWGRVSLRNVVLDAPQSDRGPRICVDQEQPLTQTGAEQVFRVTPADPGRPIRVTLVWTDAAGAALAAPALVNDLDLEVTELATGQAYKGNVFADGFSTAGGTFDDRNNVECVYVRNPAGIYEVRVIAARLSANAQPPFDNTPWQDFALVMDNLVEVP